jgi:hypothetical protein
LKDIDEPVCLFRVSRVRVRAGVGGESNSEGDEADRKEQNGLAYLLYFHGG